MISPQVWLSILLSAALLFMPFRPHTGAEAPVADIRETEPAAAAETGSAELQLYHLIPASGEAPGLTVEQYSPDEPGPSIPPDTWITVYTPSAPEGEYYTGPASGYTPPPEDEPTVIVCMEPPAAPLPERTLITANVTFADTEQGVQITGEEYLRSDGTPFAEDPFTEYLFGCRKPDPERIGSSGLSEARLFSVACFASALEGGMDDEELQYLSQRLYLPGTDLFWGGQERSVYRYGPCYDLYLFGDPLATAELHVFDPYTQFEMVLPLDVDYTQRTLYMAEDEPEQLPMHQTRMSHTKLEEYLSALKALARRDPAFAASDSYALLQFGHFAYELPPGQTMEAVLARAAAYPVLSPERQLREGDALVWPVSRDGIEYLRLFCRFADGTLSHIGFTVVPEGIAALLKLEDPRSDMYTVEDRARQPLYQPVVYLALRQADGQGQ